METGVILQRTDTGRDTIRTKAVKLTQSERLVLIVVDGMTPLKALRKKMWALTDQRFKGALHTLAKKDLVYEVLVPLENQQPEEFDSDVINRFLQQDPLDPLTIIRIDPEDELDTNLIEKMGYAVPPSAIKSPLKHESSPNFSGQSKPSPAAVALKIAADRPRTESPSKPAPDLPESVRPGAPEVPAIQRRNTDDARLGTLPPSTSQTGNKASPDCHSPEPRLRQLSKNGQPENRCAKKPIIRHRKDHVAQLIESCSWIGFITGIILLSVLFLRLS